VIDETRNAKKTMKHMTATRGTGTRDSRWSIYGPPIAYFLHRVCDHLKF